MSKGLFVVGTGTDVGKTYVTGLLLKKLHEAGLSAGYYKAAVSGNERGEDGHLIPGDALRVKMLSGIDQDLSSMCPYIYERAVSPHLASRIEGNPVDMKVVRAGFEKVCDDFEYVMMEGSGGILCPIRYDSETIWLEDIIKEFDLSSILIADAGLGTINQVVLTCKYMESKGLKVKGIIFNHYHRGDVMEEDNVKMCEAMTGIPVIGYVADGALDVSIDLDTLKSLFETI